MVYRFLGLHVNLGRNNHSNLKEFPEVGRPPKSCRVRLSPFKQAEGLSDQINVKVPFLGFSDKSERRQALQPWTLCVLDAAVAGDALLRRLVRRRAALQTAQAVAVRSQEPWPGKAPAVTKRNHDA